MAFFRSKIYLLKQDTPEYLLPSGWKLARRGGG